MWCGVLVQVRREKTRGIRQVQVPTIVPARFPRIWRKIWIVDSKTSDRGGCFSKPIVQRGYRSAIASQSRALVRNAILTPPPRHRRGTRSSSRWAHSLHADFPAPLGGVINPVVSSSSATVGGITITAPGQSVNPTGPNGSPGFAGRNDERAARQAGED